MGAYGITVLKGARFKSMCSVISRRRHPMVDGLERRVLHGIRRNIVSLHRNLGQRLSHSMDCPEQKGAGIQTAVPPELQMPLLDSGSLVAKRRIAPVCGRNSQSDRHGGLLCRLQM